MPGNSMYTDLEVTRMAAEVLRTEATAILSMAETLPTGFAQAVDRIIGVSGRVIVSGMGKSGHVARKIAATLASTGTAAMFLHPAEASHGDLGMVTTSDVCLLLSNSGETLELSDLINYTRRFSIPVISITKFPNSTLARHSDITLLLPDFPEACPIGLAPTTSTTSALALGDALAMVLMKKRGFEPKAFHVFHPGGKLGAQLTTVRKVMYQEEKVPLVSEDTSMVEVILVMTAGGFGVAGVVDSTGKLIGVVSDGDLRRKMSGLLDHDAGQVCTRTPLTVGPETLSGEALKLMNEFKVGALFVCENERPVGILHLHDLLRIGVI